jgi:hypothetical protein
MLRAVACLAFALATLVQPGPPANSGAPGVLACVKYRGEARPWGIGFKHVVILVNECTLAAECTVSTDVNPEPVVVTVPAKETLEVVTFLSSPARTFVPSVVCRSK